jgi:hypothetical protein
MPLSGLDELAAQGLALLDGATPIKTHGEFTRWVGKVRDWLRASFPDSGLVADWASQGDSRLVVGEAYYDDPTSWTLFRMVVQTRLRWLGNLPGRMRVESLLIPARAQQDAKAAGRKEIKLHATSRAYVDPDRINELKALPSANYDLSKLIRLCEELNLCFAGECYLAMIMMTRAILDHVPPIFGVKTFVELSNNYAGSKSFKDAMQHLENSSRKIADHYLHSQIRKSESMPNVTQVDFSNDIDFLLAEIGRLLK